MTMPGESRASTSMSARRPVICSPTRPKRLWPSGLLPTEQIPLIIQDKTFVDDNASRWSYVLATDPTWRWGSNPWNWGDIATPVKGDLWWPHVYMPAQNPFNPDLTRDQRFWPVALWALVLAADHQYRLPAGSRTPIMIQTAIQNGGFLSASLHAGNTQSFLGCGSVHGYACGQWDRLSKTRGSTQTIPFPGLECSPRPLLEPATLCGGHRLYPRDVPLAPNSEVKMVPAVLTPGFPDGWPADDRVGGAPDPATRGPAMIQIGTEGGFLPAPVLLPNQPVVWNTDPTTFTAGLVLQQNRGGWYPDAGAGRAR